MVMLAGFIASIVIGISHSMWLHMFISFLIGKIIVSMFGFQLALHRYFSHRSFKTGKFRHIFLCITGFLAGQGSHIFWSAQHRHHHKYADTEYDSHSPRESKFYAAGFWMLRSEKYITKRKQIKNIPVDLIRDPLLRWFDRHYYHLWVTIILVLFILSPIFLIFFILAPVTYGYINASLITLACHIKLPASYRNYNRNDDSYNNKFIQAFLLGDGLHNNHHEFPGNYSEIHRAGEFDPIGLLITKVFLY